ncbi:MAG TPA: TetR/AcrR family transcriptional regulator [Micromonosporaceae bacterium]|nr:TetR/AcrR family transcriptional regulator [Micromonosporaceae bacterium]
MPAQRPIRESARESTREGILDAALAAFTEHTFGSTSIAVVAQRAGVAVGSIYRHFPSKEALGNAVYQRWKGAKLARLRRDVDLDEPTRVAYGQVWRSLTGFAAEHPDAFAFLEYQQHEEYLDETSHALSAEVIGLAAEVLTRGQRAGEVRDADIDLLLALAYGALVGLTRAMRDGLPAERAAVAEEAVWDLLRA